MSKQKVAESRKGLIRKEESKVEVKKQLKFDRLIDDTSLWYVSIDDGISVSRRPCGLTSITESYLKKSRGWNVTVLGCWVNMNGREFIKF